MHQKLSSFHLTHPILIISYLHVIALIICNFLYPLGFIDSFYVLFFYLRTFSFFISFFFSVLFSRLFSRFFSFFFILYFFHFLLSFLFSIFLHIIIYYFFFFLFPFFLFFLIFLFSYSLLRWECLSYYHTRIPLSFFILISCLFSFFSFLCLFSTFYIAYTFHIICAISIMHSNSFGLSIDRLTWTSNYLTVLYYERVVFY